MIIDEDYYPGPDDIAEDVIFEPFEWRVVQHKNIMGQVDAEEKYLYFEGHPDELAAHFWEVVYHEDTLTHTIRRDGSPVLNVLNVEADMVSLGNLSTYRIKAIPS